MRQLPLSQGKFAIVDNDDYEKLLPWKWTFSGGYAYRVKTVQGKSKKVWLHRFIANTPEGLYTDHINGNRLDCRKENLRICTYAQNNKNASIRKDNKSGYRGVYWEKGVKKWRAVINADAKRICLGFYESAKEAAKAYNESAKKLHGSFARLNSAEDNLCA